MAESTDPKHRSRHPGSLFFCSNRENAMLIKRFLFDFMVYDMFSIILHLGEELEVAVNACCVLVVRAVGNFLYPEILGIC